MKRIFLFFIPLIFAAIFSGCTDFSENDEASLCVNLPAAGTRTLNPATGKYSSADVNRYKIIVNHSNGSTMIRDTLGENLYFENLPEGFCSITVMAIANNGDIVAQGKENYIVLTSSETTTVNMKLLFNSHLKIMSDGNELSVLKGYKGTVRNLGISVIPYNITVDQLDINYEDPALMEFQINYGEICASFNKSGISKVRFSRDGMEFLMEVNVKNPEGYGINKSELLDGNNFYDESGFWNTKYSEGYVYDAREKFQFKTLSSNIMNIIEEIGGRPILKVGSNISPITWENGDYITISKTMNNNSNCIKISHCNSAGTEKSTYDDTNGGIKILGPWGFLYMSDKTEIIFLTKYGKQKYEELKSTMNETGGIAFFSLWNFTSTMVSSSNITGLDSFWSNPNQ